MQVGKIVFNNSWSGRYVYTPCDTRTHACNCVGPHNGQPLCPCQMRDVTIRDGRYVQIKDLGPVREGD